MSFGNATVDAYNSDIDALWPMNEASGTRYDVVGSNHLTDNNNVGSAAGKNGNCATFDGVNQYLSRASAVIPVGGDCTVNMWEQSTSSGQEATILGQHSASGHPVPYFSHQPTNKITADAYNTAVALFQAETGVLTVSTWYMLTLRRSGNDWRIYVNGSSVDFDTISGTLKTPLDFAIGARPSPALYFTGKVDETVVWSAALSNAAITAFYNAGAGLWWTVPFIPRVIVS